ncbi:uncharacterized protein [Watersipora subatra]|uniref:uncharacterized protein isoform X2 n=1 Tax=Watersipora subatra TaxID=2589382 RepID=UPI00355B72AB
MGTKDWLFLSLFLRLLSGNQMQVAYILGKSYSSTGTAVVDNPGKGGYIVSHDQYDRVSDSDNNYYNDGQVQELTLTKLHQKEVIRITFLKFDLHRSSNLFYLFCDDYLEITNIRARDIYFCGYDDPTDMPTEVYAFNKSVTLRFITRKILAETSSAGFLIKYEVTKQNKNKCPPTIQNTQEPVSIDDVSETFDIKCSPGYWIDSQTYAQTVNCSTNWREYLMSCTVIECPIQFLANLSSNFTLDQTGRATIGTKATYFSSDLPTRSGTATCMSNGQWSITDFEFLPIDETSRATDNAETTVVTTSGSKTDVSKSSSTNVSIYVGVIVGIIAVAALTVLLVCLLRRRRTRSKSNRPALPPPAASPCPEKSKLPQATDEAVYSLAYELPSAAQTPDTRAQNEVYELAVNPVTSKENESDSFLTAETTDSHGLVYSLAGEEQTSLTNSVEPNDSMYYEYPHAKPTEKSLVSRLTKKTPDDGNSSSSSQSPTAAKQDQQTISMVDNELYGS